VITPTPLVALKNIDPELFCKVEYLHPSGSLKHRSLAKFVFELIESGELRRGQRIAVRSVGSAGVAVAWAGAQVGCPVDAVVPPWVTKSHAAAITWLGGTCHVLEPDAAKSRMDAFAKDGTTYVLLQAAEPRLVDHYQVVAQEILAQLPETAAVTVGIGTGLSITGIGRYLKSAGGKTQLYGVEPAEAAIASGRPWAHHDISGLAPPITQPLLDKSLLSGILLTPSKTAWETARLVARRDGLLLGPSSGATVDAALQLRRGGLRGPIVAVCSCSMQEYLTSTWPL
jgi:cysteine synthase